MQGLSWVEIVKGGVFSLFLQSQKFPLKLVPGFLQSRPPTTALGFEKLDWEKISGFVFCLGHLRNQYPQAMRKPKAELIFVEKLRKLGSKQQTGFFISVRKLNKKLFNFCG